MAAKNAEKTLLNQILENLPEGVLATSQKGQIRYCNATLGEFLGMEAESVIGHEAKMIFDQLDPSPSSPNVFHVSLLPQIRRPQRWLRVERLSASFDDEQGEIIYFTDISEIQNLQTEITSLNRQLEDSAPSDPLTGLLNRRSLIQSLEPQVSRSRRYHNPLSLIIMTLAKFSCSPSNVSTTQDQALITISNFLRDQIRWVDMIGRTGDTEFTLVLPETSKADAEKLANKIRNRLSNISLVDNPDTELQIGLHLGVTSWRKGDDTRLMLQRLYRALESAQESSDPSIASL